MSVIMNLGYLTIILLTLAPMILNGDGSGSYLLLHKCFTLVLKYCMGINFQRKRCTKLNKSECTVPSSTCGQPQTETRVRSLRMFVLAADAHVLGS